jgi:hypothetical protein
MDAMKNSVITNTAILTALAVGMAFGQNTPPPSQNVTKPEEVKATPVQITPKAKPLAAKKATAKSAEAKKAKPATTAGQSAASAKPHSTAGTSPKKDKAPETKSAPASPAKPANGPAPAVKPAVTASPSEKTAVSAIPKGKSAPAQKSSGVVPHKASTSSSKVAAISKPPGSVGNKPGAPGSSLTVKKQPVKAEEKAPAPASAMAPSVAEAAKPVEKAKLERIGPRRDPFVSPIQTARRGGPAGNCTTGKRCLDIDQLILKGVVKTVRGHMALVENASRRPYVLRVNDALYDGTVERITGDSVFFRQNTQDVLGHSSTREVVKKVSAPSV